MRIAIDTTPLQTGHKRRGIGIYTKNLIENLKKADKSNEYLSFTQGQEIPQADLVHYPYFDLFFRTLPLSKKIKTVLTIHDVIPLVFRKHYSAGIKGSLKFLLQELSLLNVSHVISDSENSKNDIRQYLPIGGDKISVVYLAAEEIFKPVNDKQRLAKTERKYNLPDTFLLYVGNLDYSKNLKRLIRSLENTKINLVLVGEAFKKDLKETRELEEEIKQAGLEEYVLRTGFVPADELVDFYNLATFFIEPSLYEGFGLPALEAMACGCPVISSSESSLPEVCGDAAIYFNPFDEFDIKRGVNEAFRMPKNDLADFKEKSLHQAQKFSWEKTAKETIQVYKNVFE